MKINSEDLITTRRDKRSLAETLLEKFVCREDRVGQAVQPISVEVSGRDEVIERLEKHLAGDCRIGLYNLLEDGTVKWAVVEFENHGPGAVDHPLETARQYQNVLQLVGMKSHLERSKSIDEENYHLWVFFDTRIEASRVNQVLKAVLVAEGLNPKCEVFPKGGHPGDNPDSVGNFVWAPFFGADEDTISEKRGGGVPTGRTVFIGDDGTLLTGACAFLQEIETASDEQFKLLEKAMSAFMEHEVDYRAKANGSSKQLLRVLENCPFIQWCQEHAENLPEPLWWAMISNLCRFENGAELIHEISAKDNTSGRYNISGTDAKIKQAIERSGPISYSRIVDLGWEGVPPSWPKSPAGWGVYLDMESAIERFKKLEGAGRLQALREFFREDFHFLKRHDQELWLVSMVTQLNLPRCELLQIARDTFDLKACRQLPLGVILSTCSLWKASPEQNGKVIYGWFVLNDMLPYRDREHRVYWSWREQIYEVGDNQPFRTMMWDTAGITHEGINNKNIWAVLKAETDQHGTLIQSVSWLHTDLKNHRVYLNLNEETSKLVVLDPKGVQLIANGSNDEHILLATPEKMSPFRFEPVSTAEYSIGVKLIDDLVLQNMACPRDDQLLYGCWFLVFPLIGFVKTIPSLRCEGSAGFGKTRAMELVSYFVYGDNHVKKATAAANYTDGAVNPMVMLDNVESKNFSGELDDFFLMAVTGIEKEKRRLGTDRGTIQEKVRCLLNSTGIENLGTTEHISRMLLVEFDRYKFKSPNWSERVCFKIAEARPVMIATHLEIMRRVLGEIEQGGIERVCTYLDSNHASHPKDRSNEFLALMTLIAEQLLLAGLETGRSAFELLDSWITSQRDRGNSASADSNPILVYLGAVHGFFGGSYDSEDIKKWGIEVEWSGTSLKGSAAQFHRTFSTVSKQKGLKYEYKNPLQLSKRIADSRNAIAEKQIVLSTTLDRTKTTVYEFSFPKLNRPATLSERLFKPYNDLSSTKIVGWHDDNNNESDYDTDVQELNSSPASRL